MALEDDLFFDALLSRGTKKLKRFEELPKPDENMEVVYVVVLDKGTEEEGLYNLKVNILRPSPSQVCELDCGIHVL